MNAFTQAATDLLTGLTWLWLFLAAFVVAAVVVYAICRAASRTTPPPVVDVWLFDAPEFLDPFPATVAHIAHMAAAGIDAEWAQMNGETA